MLTNKCTHSISKKRLCIHTCKWPGSRVCTQAPDKYVNFTTGVCSHTHTAPPITHTHTHTHTTPPHPQHTHPHTPTTHPHTPHTPTPPPPPYTHSHTRTSYPAFSL